MADHKFVLRRSDSISSLASVTSERRHHSKRPAQGALKLDLEFEAPPDSKARKKTAGTLHILVKEGIGLSTKEPYVKLYLSENGQDVKGTKQKTKPSKKGTDPLYEERFAYYLKPNMKLPQVRVQITLWDRSHLGSNSCIGGMSFSVPDIQAEPRLQGWYQLLPEVMGREQHNLLSKEDTLSPSKIAETMVPSHGGSSESLNSITRGDKDKDKRESTGSFRRGLKGLVGGRKHKDTTDVKEEKLAAATVPASLSTAQDFEAQAAAFDRFAQPVVKHDPHPDDEDGAEAGLAASEPPDELDMDASVDPDPTPVPQSATSQRSNPFDHAPSDSQAETEQPARVSPTAVPPTAVPPTAVAPMIRTDILDMSDSESRAQSELTPKALPKTEGSKTEGSKTAGPKTEPQPESKPESKPELNPEPKPEPKVEAKAESRTLPKVLPKAEPKGEPEHTPKASSKSKASTDNGLTAAPAPVMSGTFANEPPHVASTPDKSSGLKRTVSSESLVSMISVAPDQVVSAKNISGQLHLSLVYEERPGHKKGNMLRVAVTDAVEIQNKAPYVKFYISRNGTDMKDTKTKSKHGKAGLPVPIELEVPVPAEVNHKPAAYRLQISLWDHARLKANECHGAMSFSMADLLMSARTEGWFRLLPFQRGRANCEKLGGPEVRSNPRSRRDSNRSTSSITRTDSGRVLNPEAEAVNPSSGLAATTSASSTTANATASRGQPTSSGITDPPGGVSETTPSNHRVAGLRRTNSNDSLLSITSGNVVQHGVIQGEVNVNLWFEPADDNDVKYLGWIMVTVNEARHLSSGDTYVKLYLLSQGRSVRASKQKTRVVKKQHDPIFEQRFKIPVARTYSVDQDTALEISVWDSGRLKANEVLGCILFPLDAIASTNASNGWFPLISYHDSRAKAKQMAETVPSRAGRSAARKPGLTSALGRATGLPHSASQENLHEAEMGDGAGASEAAAGKKKRHLPGMRGGGSKAQLHSQVDELQERVRQLEAAEARHIQEKAALEEKLQEARNATGVASMKKRYAEAMQELDELRQRSMTQSELHDRLDGLEDENFKFQQQLKLLHGDKERMTEEISHLRDRVSDMTTEIQGLRAWKTVLVDELLKADPRALTRCTVAIANSMTS
ncbi:uncharacterized protein MONBRDRAFT_35407 [Monosiga brevicollis MX1]|uniref:C2 domain-containing protein n=1 Tax=Monosiga brevicollis TaxID=81824 RepID=A9UNU0_MONBE|nr:uncharacterized protein MONBRDRAFT_35407 [Monosiga brevicollis MX1]EDQ92759.1 predicted protein [Monosiga brevicollis MX1]|eukprot:XP_001742521.1 hypothetical protein [Monosiga brevicollis MX1]